ncbi:hypothetical protein QYE76_007951 [Lolium multiflorum]|uniref:5'-3' DNA helicase ZGRF1-like N-terminal domain-containing protein n=1 Tax=Lolium multiflorum TaxID=4521 RepID=A0AAD8QG66_LOLMU|nr:hypothetical protein QYE76_007951 [Lolium multiflorum]
MDLLASRDQVQVQEPQRWSVIYVTQLQKKNKVSRNGSILLHPDNRRIVLLDDLGITIDAKVLRINESISVGTSFEFPCHLVKVAPEQNAGGTKNEEFDMGYWIWKVCYTTAKDLDRGRLKKYDGTLRFWSSNGWLVLLNAREEPIAVQVLSKGHCVRSDSEVSFPHHSVTVGSLLAGTPPVEEHPASPLQPEIETQSGQFTELLHDEISKQHDKVMPPVMDHAQKIDHTQLQRSLDFSKGQEFRSQVRSQFRSTVHPIGKANHFLLVVSFGRAKFKLSEETVGLALESCLGGISVDFSVIQLSDRTFRFSVASRHVGFMVYSLRKFSTEQFKCYFHLWGFGGPNSRKEFAVWQQECNEEWTLVSPNKKRTVSALNALRKRPDRPILQRKNSSGSVKKSLSFAETLVYEACSGYSMKDVSLKNNQDAEISEHIDAETAPKSSYQCANGQVDNEVDPFDKLVDDMAYRYPEIGWNNIPEQQQPANVEDDDFFQPEEQPMHNNNDEQEVAQLHDEEDNIQNNVEEILIDDSIVGGSQGSPISANSDVSVSGVMNHNIVINSVNPKCFVFGHVRMHVHGTSNSSAISANGFSMVQQGVEVGVEEPPVAEGALVNALSKGATVLAGLQPPEDVTSLGVEGLVVAVDVCSPPVT